MSAAPLGPPSVIVFDVNETLSDMSPMAERFDAVGVPGQLAMTWFAQVLRDGFALAAAGAAAPFSEIAAETLRGMLPRWGRHHDLEEAVTHVLDGFGAFDVHPDVPDGVRALAGLDIRLVTLSNGATWVAEGLLDRAGIRDSFEAVLSVEDAGVWKPAPGAYQYALDASGVQPAEAMLVAVHPWDVDGAARAGLRTAWVNRAGTPYPAYFSAPEQRCVSLSGLAGVLARDH